MLDHNGQLRQTEDLNYCARYLTAAEVHYEMNSITEDNVIRRVEYRLSNRMRSNHRVDRRHKLIRRMNKAFGLTARRRWDPTMIDPQTKGKYLSGEFVAALAYHRPFSSNRNNAFIEALLLRPSEPLFGGSSRCCESPEQSRYRYDQCELECSWRYHPWPSQVQGLFVPHER